MKMTAVESSNVKEIGWEAEMLHVTFKKKRPTDTEKTYRYRGVPLDEYNQMVHAPSVGQYLSKNIIPKYPSELVAMPVVQTA